MTIRIIVASSWANKENASIKAWYMGARLDSLKLKSIDSNKPQRVWCVGNGTIEPWHIRYVFFVARDPARTLIGLLRHASLVAKLPVVLGGSSLVVEDGA